MSQQSRLAVEVIKGDDYLNIWVDANNNGVRDDDDVNIFVTRTGNVFAQNVNLKQALDTHLKQRLQEAAMAFMQADTGEVNQDEICDLALEMVIKASKAAEEVIEVVAEPVITVTETSTMPAYDTAVQYNETGVPMWRPLASH